MPTPHATLAQLGRLAPLGAILIWSGNTLVTKASAAAIDPASIAFYRWFLAWLILTPFLGFAVWRRRALVRAHAPRLAVLGALGMATYQGCAYLAAQTTSAVNMGVLVALMPLLSALLASALAGERLTPLRSTGTLVSLAGLLWLVARGQPERLWSGGMAVGDLWMLVAVGSNALYGVLLKRWASPLSTWQQLYVQIGFGSLALAPFWLAGPMTPIDGTNAPLILYAALPASLGAPFFWMTGIRRLGAARTALFMNLLPPLVAVLAWWLLGEALHGYHAVGGVIVLLGVTLGLWRRDRRGRTG
ncbi:DMT family transporter [Pseudomonas sp. RIT-PI-AD]|uniref:DMT family transporter n=1 Tax=Pseudomonas sp. RIT-PI-AD TaxID=3035294 RepID=UPI0021DB2FFD|nr:DMT family transporter [Pseudomonas sp. RIT-PI-AD]